MALNATRIRTAPGRTAQCHPYGASFGNNFNHKIEET